jgi:hypothetical protein
MLLALIVTVALAGGQAMNLTSEMKVDIERLIARAGKLDTLWPWQGPIPENPTGRATRQRCGAFSSCSSLRRS